MFGELADKIVLIALGSIIPASLTWIYQKIVAYYKNSPPNPLTVRITAISSAVSVFLFLFFIIIYDRFLPHPRPVQEPQATKGEIRRDKHAFGEAIPNKSGGPIMVTISARNDKVGNTMCANVSPDFKLQQAKPANCGSSQTVAVVSFVQPGFVQTMSFAVPRESWYNVVIDGGNIEVITWSEMPL